MTNDLLAKADAINRYPLLTELLEPAKRGYICIECGNGSGDDGTGAIIKDNKLMCGKCLHSFNNIDIIAYHLGLSTRGKDFIDVVKFGCDICGIPFEDNLSKKDCAKFPSPTKTDRKPDTQKNKLEKVSDFKDLADAQKALPNFVQSQGGAWRGLTLETLQHARAGFLPAVYFPAAKKKLPAVVIPNDLNGVYFRSVQGKFHKNNKPMATTTIYLPNTDTFDIVITEGQINAASIFQAVFSVTGKLPEFGIMAGSGTGAGQNTILPRLNELKAQGKNFRAIIAYDNDSNGAGQTASKTALESLLKAGYAACRVDITKSPDVDLNDVLGANNGDLNLFDMIQKTLAQVTFDVQISATDEEKDAPNFGDVKNFEEIEKQIAADEKAFEDEKTAAIETIRNLEDFANTTILTSSILRALAFCKEYEPLLYSTTINAISEYSDKHPKEKVNLQDLKSHVKQYRIDIQEQAQNLTLQRLKLHADKTSTQFVSDNDLLHGFTIPESFAMSNNGVWKVGKNGSVQVCNAPITITRKINNVKINNVDDNTVSYFLAYYDGQNFKNLSEPVSALTIADRQKIIKLAEEGFPVTSNNANLIVDFLYDFIFANKSVIPTDFAVKNCGWLKWHDNYCFIDPRLPYNIYTEDIKQGKIIIDKDNYLSKFLVSSGDLEKIKQAFDIAAESSPIAAFLCYLAVSPFLLRILNERNFVVYVYGKTRGGKSTALNLAASLVGSPKMIFTFDSTPKVIPELAAVYSDYFLPIDEKQVADANLSADFAKIIYALANGTGRIKLNKDSTIRIPKDWRNITVANGETPLLGDNVTGGAKTRLLQIAAPDTIINEKNCKIIRDICVKNHGLPFPLILKLVLQKLGDDFLIEMFNDTLADFEENFGSKILSEYLRYIAVAVVGGFLLYKVFGVNEDKEAFEKAYLVGLEILKMAPTLEDISDVEVEKQMILDFIAVNQNHFIGGNIATEKIQGVWGTLDDAEFIYIARPIVQKACKDNGFDYKKLVKDLIDAKFFIGEGKNPTVQKWIGGANGRYFKIKKDKS